MVFIVLVLSVCIGVVLVVISGYGVDLW